MMVVMSPNVLCVDDERELTDLLKFLLTRVGYEVRTADSGQTALAAVRARPPDLIVLDLMLPDLDGFGVFEILRREPLTASIPVMMLSAWATADAKAHGLALGAQDYLTKPFRPAEIIAHVQRLLPLRTCRSLPSVVGSDWRPAAHTASS